MVNSDPLKGFDAPSSTPARLGGFGVLAFLVGFACAFAWTERAAAAELITEIDPGGEVKCAAFSPDGSEIAVGLRTSNLVKIFNPRTGEEIRDLKVHEATGVFGVCYSRDGVMLASGGRDETIKLWYVGTGKLLATMRGHKKAVTSVIFSRDGTKVISASEDGTIRLWRTRDAAPLREMERHRGAVNTLAGSADGKWFAGGGEDLRVRLWEMATGNWLHSFRKPVLPVRAVAFTPDGKRVACAGEEGTVFMWEVETGRFVKSFGGHTWGGRAAWPINCLAFFPDGRFLVSGAGDGTAKVWDVVTGEFVQTIRAHVGGVNAVAISADGELLATGGGITPVTAAEDYELGPVWGNTDKKSLKIWDGKSAETSLSFPMRAQAVSSAEVPSPPAGTPAKPVTGHSPNKGHGPARSSTGTGLQPRTARPAAKTH